MARGACFTGLWGTSQFLFPNKYWSLLDFVWRKGLPVVPESGNTRVSCCYGSPSNSMFGGESDCQAGSGACSTRVKA